MIAIEVPGQPTLQLHHLVCDVNGTLAVDGQLVAGVRERLQSLAGKLTLHLLTADTHGKQAEIDRQLGLVANRITPGGEAEQKAGFVRSLGAGQVAAIGQGANDALMLQAAALGICILSPEGTAVPALLSARLVVPDILTALDLLEKPRRVTATLRR